jgi:hypothetical protein
VTRSTPKPIDEQIDRWRALLATSSDNPPTTPVTFAPTLDAEIVAEHWAPCFAATRKAARIEFARLRALLDALEVALRDPLAPEAGEALARAHALADDAAEEQVAADRHRLTEIAWALRDAGRAIVKYRQRAKVQP